jgi:hypothetical protein
VPIAGVSGTGRHLQSHRRVRTIRKISKRTWQLIENKNAAAEKSQKRTQADPPKQATNPAKSATIPRNPEPYTSTVNAFSVRCTGL